MSPLFFGVNYMAMLFLGMLLVSWFVPDHYPPWLSFHTEVPAFVAANLALWAYLFGNGPKVKVPSPVVFIALLGLSAVVQWVGGVVVYGGDVVVTLIYLTTFASAWLGGHLLAKSDQKVNLTETMALVSVLGALIVAFQVLAQWMRVEGAMAGWVIDGLQNGRPRGNIGQPNQAATVLLMGAVGAALLRHRARMGPAAMWFTALFLGAAIVLTQSRTALLSAGVLSVLGIFFIRTRKVDGLTRGPILLWVSLLYLAAWRYTDIKLSGAVTAVVSGDQMVAVGTRPLIWTQLVIGLFDSPWVGWGWLQIPAAQQAGAIVLGGSEQTNYAHNAVLDLFLFVGIPAACVVLCTIGLWWWKRASLVIASKDAAQSFLLLMPILVHCLLEFPHAYAYFLVLAGLLLGGIDAWTTNVTASGWHVPKSVLTVLAVLFTTMMLATGYEYAQAEEDFRINRFENRKMGETPADYIPPKLMLLTQLGDMLKAMRLRAKPGMTPSELDTLVRASKRYSWAQLQFRTALSLGLNDRAADASQQLRVIKGLFSANVYEEAKENWRRLQREQYPELGKVVLP